MEVVWWIVIIALFVLSFVGMIFPVIPSVLVIWVGFLIYQFGIESGDLSWWFWIGMLVLTLVLFIADIVANSFFVKKYGGSKWGERVAAISVIIGSFIFPPFGLILVPFLAVLVTEYIQTRDMKKAVVIGFASFVGFLSSTFAKVVIQGVMIAWFGLEVFF